MQRQTGSILIVSGTAIGAGMLALPLVLANFGLPLTLFIMFAIWAIMYYVSLVNIELVLDAGKGLTLAQLGKKFSGPMAQTIGLLCLKILTYSLLAAYIAGGASVLQKLILSFLGVDLSATFYIIMVAAFLAVLLAFTTRWIDYANRLLFLALIVAFIILLMGLLAKLNLTQLPIIPLQLEMNSFYIALPIVFTSFGYQVVIHSMTTYCHYDKKMLKRVFFWGSLIPTIVYLLWTICVLGVLFVEKPLFFNEILKGDAQLGDMIQALSEIGNAGSIHLFSSLMLLLVITTSAIGVGLGLRDSWRLQLERKLSPLTNSILSQIITFVPPLIVVLLIPNAFIKALSFAGMISAIIAVLMPIYLLYKSKISNNHYHYPILQYISLRFIALAIGLIVIFCEIMNLWF
jgi:tyrosine-specific transport protein